MPYYESPFKSGKYKWYDPIKIQEQSGLSRVLREPMDYWMKNSHVQKYDLFVEYPFMEHLDWNRQLFEAIHPVRGEDRRVYKDSRLDEPYCCWPVGCLLCSAMGCTTHWPWRRAFERQLPYWDIRETAV